MATVDTDVEKLERLCTVGWDTKWYRPYEKQYAGSYKNYRKNHQMISNSTCGDLPIRMGSKAWGGICTLRFIEALLTIAKMWDNSINKWADKQNVVYTREYYIASKRKKILTYAIIQLNFDDIMLNEISQSQKDKYYMIPLMWGT